jgi:DNA transformation protein
MSGNDDLLEILEEALGRLGRVTGRRMFGGVGVYFDGIFFALIDDGVIYFRTSDTMRPRFEAEGSRAFSYMTKNGPAALVSYWRLPERLLDDPEELCDWARESIAAARAVALEKARKTTRAVATKPKPKTTKKASRRVAPATKSR